MVMYADDVQFLHLDKPDNLLTLQTSVENTMHDAKRWFAENSLKMNPAITDFVLIKHKQRRNITDLEVQLDDVKIKSQCMAQGITHLNGKFQVYGSIQMASSTDQTRQCTENQSAGCRRRGRPVCAFSAPSPHRLRGE